MKTKISMRIFLIFIILLVCSSSDILGQTNKMDSLIYSKNLNVLKGIALTYYSAEFEIRAKECQATLQNLVDIYYNNDTALFKLKLAVIDSVQWTGFWVPYGFFFISQGWIVIPGDLDFQKFSHLMGYYKFSEAIKKNLKRISNDPEYLMTESFYKFSMAHELGHSYVSSILKARTPDRWISELMACYFAVDFLNKYDKKILKAFNIFWSTFLKENTYQPEYRTLSDFNSKYEKVGFENYIWYACMIYEMTEEIYSKYKSDFISLYTKTFPRSKDQKKFTQEELIKTMDNITEGIYSKWIKIMEGNS